MAEAVGGAILSAVIQVLVEKLASREVAGFFQKNLFVSKLRTKLKVKLGSANSLLNDAEDKELKNENVKNWVDSLNEVLNEADNAIDDINTKALRCNIEGKALRKKIIHTVFNMFAMWAMKQKLEEIIESLELLLGEADRLGLKTDVPSKRLERCPAPLIGDPSDVYGRDGDKKAILDLLFIENSGGQDKITVIPIVGMGGVGKTTLARLVYNDNRVKDYFNHRAWVTMSGDFDVLKIAKLVFEGLSGKECKFTELGKLGEELEKFLGGNKFFLVLDDVWSENYNRWNSLNSYFQVGSDGSKIIVTTRNVEIGSMMGSVKSHPLTPMTDEDCWKLFQKHAFRSVEESTKHEVETIGIEIVKKCKGLPLAVMSLAGLLCSVSDPKEWEKVLKSDVWELERKGDDEILPSLWLSYSYLPSNIKRCFSYCSIFPKDYKLVKEKVILLWMAEGLLQGDNMEDDGEEYFKTLVSRSLLQRSAEDESSFVMHDLVHDLATFVSCKGFCMRLGEGEECLSSKTRHLLFYYDLDDLKGLSRTNSLRTFISNSYMGDQVLHEIPKKFGCLRVLCLSIKKVPDSIGKLKHLRYLDLSESWFERLPDTICTLNNLQTLLLRQCRYLTHLPAKMHKLINLRHLDISETRSLKEIPQCVHNLKALRTITKVVVGIGSKISELIKFPQLPRCLEVFGLENIVNVKDVLEAEFKENNLVSELILCWGTNDNDAAKDRAILDAMKPHSNLKKLNIDKYGGIEFSDWVVNRSFSNVTEVSLEDCKHCCQLPPFGQLPSLKKLEIVHLHSIKTISSEFYGSSGAIPFPCLKILHIRSMDELQSWSFEAEGSFPCLEGLQLQRCPMLKSLSPHCLPSLKSLTFGYCYQMEALLLPIDQEMNTTFPSLEIIEICNCPKLEFSGLPLPSSLKELNIWDCDLVYAQRMSWGLEALTQFKISAWNANSFPEEGLLPTTLVNLDIKCIQNLKSLNGKVFQHLTSLKTLKISSCSELHSLPEEGLPASLRNFHVLHCPILKPRLKRGTGEDWHKISHIPKVYLDGKET